MRRVVRQGFEQGNYASVYRDREERTAIEQRFLNAFADRIPRGGSVVDLGCGVGEPFDRWLVDEGFQVKGVDIVGSHVNKARRRVPEAEFVQADLSKWNPETTFDAALSLYTIFHLPAEEHREVIEHIGRMLAPGAPLLVTLGTARGDSRADDWCGAPMAWSSLAPEAYREAFAETGFEIVEEATEGAPGDDEHHWWVLAERSPSRCDG